MNFYVVYDDKENILRYGRSSDRTFEAEKQSGLKIMKIPKIKANMDLTHKVNLADIQNPILILKTKKIEDEKI